ncbi:RHS repeat-associated core domain-containing protein [Pseudomonas sp. zfem002]|uniref:RHS repeat-associated core domain-containing protein n=1 Tax=Pseudomonas sp. zfem002 TaxID=3078197 RepID=UPI002929AABC|nr:RHS repeat-associated core domain-containing protein [Pseudomonas sp. zfem002]MDU9389398.1 RHS repeat-associated core domain-containing protein [Pseudomonas sp. zfem002]
MQTDSSSASRSLLLAVDRHASPLLETSDGQLRRQVFSPYGGRATVPGEGAALGFNGEYLERSGVYLLGSYRAYSPALRRFCQPDNLSPFAAGGLNAYAYCLGDPVNYTDPDGQVPWSTISLLSAVFAGASLTGAIVSKGQMRQVFIALTVITSFMMVGSGGAALAKHLNRRNQIGAPPSASPSPPPVRFQDGTVWLGRSPPPPYRGRSETPPPYRERSETPASYRATSDSLPPYPHSDSDLASLSSFRSRESVTSGGYGSSASSYASYASDGPTTTPPLGSRAAAIRSQNRDAWLRQQRERRQGRRFS